MTSRTYHLQFVLPELFLLRLVKKRKLSHMVDKDMTKDGQFRIDRRHFSILRSEWRSESLERGRGIELLNLFMNLSVDEFSF